MDARQERGRLIAEKCRIDRKGDEWLVPSQSGPGRYTVKVAGDYPRCTCPDYEDHANKCKHIFAVEHTLSREVDEDGTVTETETLRVTATVKRKTYAQPSWSAYNAGQTNERRLFLELLSDLCDTIQEPERNAHPNGGRPYLPMRDTIFAACLKVRSQMSARRFSGELDEAHAAGYLASKPHFNSVLSVFDREEATPILKQLIETSSLPLRFLETQFAIDSTGFGTQKYASWYDHRYGVERKTAKFVKAHFATGVRTNVVTAVNIDHQDAADSPQFPGLMDTTAKEFVVENVTADKAYASTLNFDTVESHGGRFFPAFKSNATGAVGGAYAKAFHYFQFKREEYLAIYHQRSNVESTVSMVKRKLGDSVKAKNDLAQKNEVYAKFVCHNVIVLISEMYTLGIQAMFTRPTCTTTALTAQQPN